MPSSLKYSFLIFSLIFWGCLTKSHGQDSLQTNELSRPEIELSLGSFNYFGDIGNLEGISQSRQLNWAYRVSFRNKLSNSFGLSIFGLYGNLNANERLIDRDANFESEILMGGLSVQYNFNALLPKERLITPFISLGITSFEFNPKGDQRDENGLYYHYWNDGSIRSLPQQSPNSNDAIILQRDYNYETDLRATREREDQYELRALSIPVGVGVDIEVSPSFQIRMGTEYHFTTTDFLDNISSSEETGNSRKGNDHFLYTHLGLAYNLKHKKKTEPSPYGLESDDLLGLEYADQDEDGVGDIVDLCPNTPVDAVVDLFGCPVDGDKDGVPDYRDLEMNTLAGERVNLDGVTVSDEEIETMYQLYKDSVGEYSISKSQTYTADVVGSNIRLRSKKKGYRIEFTNTSELTPSQIGELLSIHEIQAEDIDGVTTYYLGEYSAISEAAGRKITLDETGFESRIVYFEFGERRVLSDSEVASISEFAVPIDLNSDKVIYRVQIGAYRYRLSSNVFKDVPDLLIIEGNDGLTRYVSGSFKNLKSAAEHKVDLLLKGFEGAFVTAYKSGNRITLKEAGAAIKEEELKERSENDIINKELVNFTIQLAAFEGRVPAKTLSDLMSIGNVRPVRTSTGTTRYVTGSFKTLVEAESELDTFKSMGFNNAEVKGDFNGKIISVEEAQELISE